MRAAEMSLPLGLLQDGLQCLDCVIAELAFLGGFSWSTLGLGAASGVFVGAGTSFVDVPHSFAPCLGPSHQ
jgi:hypothetical protein